MCLKNFVHLKNLLRKHCVFILSHKIWDIDTALDSMLI